MPEEKQKSSRWFTCLVKGPLGCLAFAFGAVLVLVLFVPAVAGRLLERGFERDFAATHAGSLEVSEAWLGSLYNPQRIERLILRDPAGEEVLRGSLRAPALGNAFAGRPYGPIELDFQSVKLVEHADGSTNLERALRATGEAALELQYSLELPGTSEFLVRIGRLRWADARGREEQLADLVWRGTLATRAARTRLVLEGGTDPDLSEPFSLALEIEDLHASSDTGRLVLSATRVPLGLLRHLLGREVPVGVLAGPTLDVLEWTRRDGRANLRLGDRDFALECEGVLADGRLRSAPGVPARLVLDPGSAPGEALLSRLVPFLVPQVLPGEQRVTLECEGFELPLAGGWEGLAGRVRFTLAAGTFGLEPAAAARLGVPLTLAPLALEAELELVDGRVLLDGLALPLLEGRLEYAGSVELATGATDVSFVHELHGERMPLGRWSGLPEDLAPALPAQPEAPEPPAAPEAR